MAILQGCDLSRVAYPYIYPYSGIVYYGDHQSRQITIAGCEEMSGGHFNYTDMHARWEVEEALDRHTELYAGSDDEYCQKIHRHALLLKSVSAVLFQWLHDYDWAASGDTSFDTLDEQVKEHIKALAGIVAAKDQPPEA
jgi:hypothetical protein